MWARDPALQRTGCRVGSPRMDGGMKAGKVWGTTRTLLATPTFELHRLAVLPGGHCSIHHHAHRWNAFHVIAGELRVEVWQKAYDLVDVTELGPGDVMTVGPGLRHRFSSDVGCDCIEVYYPELLGTTDIERMTQGGRK